MLCVLSVKALLCAAVRSDPHQGTTLDWDCNNLHDTHRLILRDRIQSLLSVQLLLALTLFFAPARGQSPKIQKNIRTSLKRQIERLLACFSEPSSAGLHCLCGISFLSLLIPSDTGVVNISLHLEPFCSFAQLICD